MPRRMFEHRCENGHKSTHWVNWEEKTQTCPECGRAAERVISAPRIDLWGLAEAGCPGAHERTGDLITQRHRDAGQYHTGLKEED